MARRPRPPPLPPELERARRRAVARAPEPPGPFFAIGELQQKTGIPLRTLIFWADRLVLRATAASRAGRGTHRRFPFRELQIAALLKPLSRGGLPIGVLGTFASIFRQAIAADMSEAPPVDAGPPAAAIGAAIARATAGTGKNWMVAAYLPPDKLSTVQVCGDSDDRLSLPLDSLLAEAFPAAAYPEEDVDRSEAIVLLLDLNLHLRHLQQT
jgi:DNA-binding transcriptional MerR regulator